MILYYIGICNRLDRSNGSQEEQIGKDDTPTLKYPKLYQAYSREHISSDEVFSKILKKPSIVQKKNDTSYENQGFCHWKKTHTKKF